jgi:positive regulator of sigma E activity
MRAIVPNELSAAEQAFTPELEAYYANRALMWRNVALISLSNIAWTQAFLIIGPLMAFGLLESGVTEGAQAALNGFNSIVVSVLVMYFSWKSDHTVTRFGRRLPYLFISAPFIVTATLLFPILDHPASLVILYVIQLLFMDMKSSTFPLLSIDCVRRDMLARAQSVLNIGNGIIGFIAMRGLSALKDGGQWIPFMVAAGLMLLTTLTAFGIKEPPLVNSTKESFRPLSAIRIGLKDARIIWLMAGVALILSFQAVFGQWTWLWSKTALGLDRADIFDTLSWCLLVNVVLAWPVGWIIDHWGGFKVVLIFYALQLLGFILVFQVAGRMSLTAFSIIMMMSMPLYQAADIMVYKRCHPKDVGSVTSTNSFFRNLYLGILTFSSGTIIELSSRNYLLVFVLGFLMTTVGLCFFFYYRRRSMERNNPQPEILPIASPSGGAY